MGAFQSEWLVSNQRGFFAMGTPEGIRTRKYHGFFMGIAGRSESAFLSDLEIECDGISLWPHSYFSPSGPIIYPLHPQVPLLYELTHSGPQWQWVLPQGRLQFSVSSGISGGISLTWKWLSRKNRPVQLRVRGLWAMRNLHQMGGSFWRQKPSESYEGGSDFRYVTIESDVENEGEFKSKRKVALCRLNGNWIWKDDPRWYENFHYSEEAERGYESQERIFSAGFFDVDLTPSEEVSWTLATERNDLVPGVQQSIAHASRVCDFILHDPSGVCAGYPWFGEWGRDTFVSLPGIVASSLVSKKNHSRTSVWAEDVLNRWGQWILTDGMLPNVLQMNQNPQWESADATLWWCHSVASLWLYEDSHLGIKRRFSKMVDSAIRSIRAGKHRFLKENLDGTLEVTEPHATWMDARVQGRAVTPRVGRLPEINALWFQVRCLQWLWSNESDFSEIEILGRRVLQCREESRPNQIFFHSIPLAPSFILKDFLLLEKDLLEISQKFWTPVGLKSLDPADPHFRPRCIGTQTTRDLAYHQGSAWGWLGGHFEMAHHRWDDFQLSKGEKISRLGDRMFLPAILADMPISGHIPEIFDADPPYSSRGAPAQAWSLACVEEANVRKRLKLDSKLTDLLARRWLGHKERSMKRQSKDGEVNLN